MLLTLSALSFFLDFLVVVVVTSRPEQARHILDDSLSKLRHVTKAFIPDAPSNNLSPIGDERNVIPIDDANLMTK